MRTLLAVLLLVNILYFLWPKPDQTLAPPPLRGQGEIPILITLDEQYDMPAPGSPVPLLYDPQTRLPSIQVAAVEVVPAEPDLLVAEAGDFDDSLDTDETLEEGPVTSITNAFDEAQEEPAQEEAAKPTRACFTLGPFRLDNKARSVIKDLTEMGATASKRSAVERRTRGYWVYLPPFASRERASTEAEILTTRGLTDYFVVSNGQHDNAISLGLFTLKSGSERRIKQLKDLGYKPKVEVRFSEFPVYWVDIETIKPIDWPVFMRENFPRGRINQLKRSCS